MAIASFFFVAFFAVSAFGAPEFACKCNKMYDPVCGTNGQTYPNLCMLSCERANGNDKLAVAYSGACHSNVFAESPCICTADYRPVCGSDGVTYGNQCALNCAARSNTGLRFQYEGECKTPQVCACPDNYLPVCGTDGKTYPNACELRCGQQQNMELAVAYQGECHAEICACPDNYMPVCGTDGKTYANACELKCGQHNNMGLEVAYPGECSHVMELDEVYSCACTDNYLPVCGSNGNTYPNECELNCDKKAQPGLQVTHQGPCSSSLLSENLS